MASASQARARKRTRSTPERDGPALFNDILAMAGSLASSRKAYAAAQLESLADSVREFNETIPAIPTVKAYAATAADSLEELASYVVESDLSDMVTDAREFSRRHPLATFGGSIAAGLLITQLLQSRTSAIRETASVRRIRKTRPSSASGAE